MLIWLCWIVYACSYIGKVNYAANINQVISFYNISHSEAGLVSTCFFFAYGIGQVVNGFFCKKYPLKWVVFSSLVISATVNFAIGITNRFEIIKFLWLINGFSLSILWPCLIRLLSETLPKKDMAQASMIMGTTVATGTFIVYGLSALFVKINFKIVFYLATAIFVVVSLLWLLFFARLVNGAKEENEQVKILDFSNEGKPHSDNYNKSAILVSIILLGFYGIATNLIKDGLTTWVPSILKEQYHLDNSISIILTLALPLVAIFANSFAIKVHKKVSDFVLQCAIAFFVAGIIIGGVIGGVSLNQFWLTLIGFTIVCFLISSCNSVITNIFPLFMKGKLNSGFIAGILNGCCYLGSTISSYGLGVIADSFGWLAVFWVLLAVCAVVCLCAAVYLFVKKLLLQNTQESR